MVDPDQRADKMIASNGAIIGQQPTLQLVLRSKGFLDQSDPNWTSWVSAFGQIRKRQMEQIATMCQSLSRS